MLVNPPRFRGIPVIREGRCENADRDCVHPPTSLVYLASILESVGHKVDLVDANGLDLSYSQIEANIRRLRPNWIVFRSTPSTFYWDCETARLAKSYGIRNIMLNWNLHHAYTQVLKECEDIDVYLNIYDYEYAVPMVIEKYPYHVGVGFNAKDDIPFPAWGKINDFGRYYTRTKFFSPWAVVCGSRGCPYHCDFCIDSGTGWRPRKPELIVDEIEYLVKTRGVPYISFYDNTFEVDEKWCLSIAEEIVRRNLRFKWYINSRADLICRHGAGFFKLLRDAGLDGSSIGIEFGSDRMLRESNKGTTVAQGKEAISILHKAGVKSYVSCMMGYLNETKAEMQSTVDFIKETKPTGFQINLVTPYIGTKLFREALDCQLVHVDLDWRGMSCIPTDLPPVKLCDLSPDELVKMRRKAYVQIYFSRWLISNFFRLKGIDDVKMGAGYFLSGLNRLVHRVEFSH